MSTDSTHQLAARYNFDLAARNPTRAAEIEWRVDRNGNLRLRDRPEWSARRRHQVEKDHEFERKEWIRRNDSGAFDQRVPINEQLDI